MGRESTLRWSEGGTHMAEGNLRRTILVSLLGVALIAGVWLLWPKPPAAPAPGPRVGKAGETTDVIPKAYRGQSETAGRELAKATPVYWQDVVWTEKAARARLTIVDGSILNLGPETHLQVLPREATSNQSALVLKFGKIRAEVQQRSQGEGPFQIQTPTAVIGVVGTEFYLDASPQTTAVICLKGQVKVRNRKTEIAGEQTLNAGEKTSVQRDLAPEPKSVASADEIAQALGETSATPPPPPPLGPGLDLTLPDRRSTQVNLRRFSGRVLVINYFATWAPPAKAQIPILNTLNAEFRNRGVEFIGIAGFTDTGGWGTVDQFMQTTPIDFRVLLDEGGRAEKLFGITGVPTTILVDRQGRILPKQTGLINADRLRPMIESLLQRSAGP